MLRRLILVLLACTAVLPTATVQAKTLNVSLILSDNSPPYRQFADMFSGHFVANQADVNIDESSVISGTQADLIVAVGMKAAKLAAVQVDTPVLAVMVPESGYQELVKQMSPPDANREISAVYLDQPWTRRLEFLRAVLPEKQKIGLLYSPGTNIDIEGLRKNIAAHGGSLIARLVHAEDRLFPVLENLLVDSDVLLAVPDSTIYVSSNIRNILLTSYRHNVPMVGISKAYVNAGALCAIFSTPEQLAAQAEKAVILFARSRRLPAPQYPDAFAIEVNHQVARSLGIEVPSEEAIRGRMDMTQERDR